MNDNHNKKNEGLFKEIITDRHSWKKYTQSKEAFMPLIKHIYEANHIKINLDEISCPSQSSNAIFRTGDKIVKIFYPPETKLKDAGEYDTELLAMKHCKNLGILTPDVTCTGTVYDSLYSFHYIVMNYIDGIEAKDAIPSYSDSEKVAFVQKLKEIANKIHVITNLKIPRYDDPEKIDNILWNNMPESFREDRKRCIADTSFPEAVFTHGDFGERNIIIDKHGRVNIIDFAESLIAPYYYDSMAFDFGHDPIIMGAYYGEYKNDEFYETMTMSCLLNWFGAVIIEWFAKDTGIDFTSITNVNVLKTMLIKRLGI